MIVSSLSHWPQEREYAHPVLRKAIDFLHDTDFSLLDEGKYPIWDQDMYALISKIRTKPASMQSAEKHECFLDIHFVIEGEEMIGWQLQNDQTVPFESHPDQDYSLYTELGEESMIRLAPGMYTVLFPEDIHRPGLTEAEPSDVRKVVIKINRNLF
ncbi:YhcH/YjgK/YiaL family protein [Paenibacillus chibensis]|uniref:YhcH/YjgK/YiaL family protein n=1 Tax=Paenibacillus chibensis TaxID=59846 RepID=A0ABU6PQW5_9BACL|nr:YhcH/YjgK/YiaL family protein [Paenibacillus chibensis]